MFTATPIELSKDSRGRTRAASYDVELSFIMMQTTADELANLTILADPACNSGPTGWDDGACVLFTDAYVTAAAIATPTASGYTWNEWEFRNCPLRLTPELKFNSGEESFITVSAKGTLNTSELANLGTFVARGTDAMTATITL